MKKYIEIICMTLAFVILVSLFSFESLAADYAPDAGAFVFNGESLLQYIQKTHNLNLIYDPYENALRTVVNSTAADPDPYFMLDYALLPSTLRAQDFTHLLITYRCPQTNSKYATTCEVFLSAGEVTGSTAGRSILFDAAKGEKYTVQDIYLPGVAWWNGDIHNIRIDTFTKGAFGDTMYIDSIILCRDDGHAREVRSDRLKQAGTPSDTPVSDFICSKYDVQKYTSPVWKGNIVYNEAVYPIKEKDGNAVYTLMYTPEKVQSVYDATFSKLYREGVDYTVEGNKLKILPDGAIPTVEYTYIHPTSNPNNYSWDRYYNRTAAGDGKWEYWGQSPEFYAGYLNVTYTHKDTWKGWIPENKASALPVTSQKIQNNEKMNVVFFGDSITGGANSSSYRNVYPFAEYWNEQIIRKLKETYGCTNISAYYSAEGGSSSSGMVSKLNENVIRYAPDLVFIAFGMNDCMNESQDSDGSMARVREQYKNAVNQMIGRVRRQYPDCEFVLVPSFYGNTYCHYSSYYDACRDTLLELENTYSGVVCADVTSMQGSLLEYKDYLDFSGDNMCHPNDFMARLYAQVCLETIVPGGIDAYVPKKDSGEEPDPGPVEPGTLGDINGDGRLTPGDVTLLRLYLAGKSGDMQVVRTACDLNGDGRITPADVTTLRLYLAGKITLK